ncbi:class I Glutamine amidotransferase domain containing protein [Richelia sinica FACHB-800]|uniref:Class I Glutamine amidotransferase domain containing protein n=1 Tax=Richelia sinica FACHB-800 TaxID=1357546 RepID=A0A975T8H6_9NOST|nr:glutamine amidotransferase [Richelia sinica]MBD2666569.1 glutamine amidotransferase [Richelia sinica FACHB-800]QXE24186.1 class I Glutamine amidotransferase domain containing protein [Richelia sinica FACHB-800]
MKRATVIRHVAFEDLGTLAGVLKQQNYAVTYFEAGRDNLADIAPLNADLLVILGGPIGAYDEQDYPFIVHELHLLEHRLAADLPTLGICLGAQLMARVLGARVFPGGEKEIGWSPLTLTNAGVNSAVGHLNAEHTSVLHWHGDTFDLPDGATLLAKSAKYDNQAFSWGKYGLGLQFHPEVTVSGLERWFIGHACEINATPGISVKQLRQDTANYAPKLETQAIKFWRAWLASVDSNLEIPVLAR